MCLERRAKGVKNVVLKTGPQPAAKYNSIHDKLHKHNFLIKSETECNMLQFQTSFAIVRSQKIKKK